MSKPWKQIKIFICDTTQQVIIEPTPEFDGICFYQIEEVEDGIREFRSYMSIEEAKCVANELLKYAEELENE